MDKSDELLPDFLQGWYLLADANLDVQERNLVQTAVAGNFSLERIAQELRAQFPEADLLRRDQGQRNSNFWNDEATEDQITHDEDMNLASLARDGMTKEGMALITDAEVEAEEALALLQQAKRTLRDARSRQHQVKMSRQYYKVTSEKGKYGGPSNTTNSSSGIKCFKCGGPHKIAVCPDRAAPGRQEANQAQAEEAPFVCYVHAEGEEDALTASDEMSTSEATRLGYGVIDGGATKTLASVTALEALVERNMDKHNNGRVISVDTDNKPLFGFGNSTKDKRLSTTRMGITAANKDGELTIHTLDKGDGPILVSIATLRSLKAIIDFENDLVVFRALDDQRVVPLTRSKAGHQLISLSDDLYKDALPCTEKIRSLKDFCS